MSPTKKILIGLGVATVLLVLVAVLVGGGEEGTEVETATAQVRAITESVTASGRVAAASEVSISPDVSGEVVFVGVEEGDRVERGQLLLRIRADAYASQAQQARSAVREAQTGVGEARTAVDQARAQVAQSRADLPQLRASLAQAEAEQTRAEQALARAEGLVAQGLGSQAELETARAAAAQARAARDAAQGQIAAVQTRIQVAEAQVRGAQARVQGAQARVGSAQASAQQAGQQLGKTSIYAPMSGTVTYLNVEPGERVVGTATMQGTELLRIAELDAMTIEIDVNETDVVRLALGDSARVEVDAFPEDALAGTVTEIASSGRSEPTASGQGATAFPVTIQIRDAAAAAGGVVLASADGEAAPPPPSVRLRPGMSGTADVFAQTIPRAVVVPIQAVTVRDFNELRRDSLETARAEGDESADPDRVPAEEDLRRVVFVVEDGEAVMREVDTGIADDTHIEITRGLAGGETVVTGPFKLLRSTLDDGDAVREKDD